MSLEVVVARSARPKAGVSSAKAIVVAPFADAAFVSSPGGDGVGVRQYDPGTHASARETISAPLDLSFRQGTVTGVTDALASIVYPDVDAGSPPPWVSARGHESRAFDRRLGREVFGPHWYTEASDIIVTNGLVRLWVMTSTPKACLAVDAVESGAWHHLGYLEISSGPVTSARVVSVTPDRVVLAVTAAGAVVRVQLRRGERMLRLTDAIGATWRDLPPLVQQYGALPIGTGRFRDAAVFAAADLIEFRWPVTKAAWGVAGWWIPDAASGAQGDSGIWYAADTAALASTLMFRGGALEWTQAGVTLTSAPLTFAAGEPVFIAMSYSAAARRLTVRPASGAVSHVTDVVGTGTAEANFATCVLAPLFGDLGGYSDTYSDTYDFAGVGTWGFDNLMVFDDALSAAEAALLAAGSTGLGALPSPESRLAWFASFDDPAAAGLVRGIVTVGDDQGAYLAKPGATYDDVADHEAQFGAEFEQQIRVR